MVLTSKDKWLKFFLDAKIPKSAAEEYTLTFVNNRIQSDMLLDLDKEYLNAMGITVMGDIIAILKHAKVCHVQNAKRNMLSSSSSSLTDSNKPTALSSDSNYRSVSLKKANPTIAKPTFKSVTKPILPAKNSSVVKSKIIPSINSTQTKVPNVREGLTTDRSIKINNKKPLDIRTVKNGERLKVAEKEVNKPIPVRVPLVRKRPSTELLKSSLNNNGNQESESDSSHSDTDETIEDITRKMAKKSIFDRLGNPGSKPAIVDNSERAVSSSTSPVTSSKIIVKKVIQQPDGAPKPGTLSYRMFPPHVHSTSSSTDELSDTALDGDNGERILIEIDQGRDQVSVVQEPLSKEVSRVEYTVALPPDFASSSPGGSAKAGGSVFDRLGGKNKIQSSSSVSNPGKSILKIKPSSLRISKPSSPLNLLPNKRDFKSLSSLNNKLSLIRSQFKTEGVLGKPESAMRDKLPAKARIGTATSTTAINAASQLSRTKVPTTPISSVKDRLTLSGVTESDKKPPVFNSKLDVLAKRTLNSTPAHVKARIESEQQMFLSKAKCGSGIKARLGFKTRGEKISLNLEHDERRTKSLTPEKSDPVFEREILTNGEEEAEMTLGGKKRVRFHCVEKKLIPNRKDDPFLQRRFSSPLPSSKYRARVW